MHAEVTDKELVKRFQRGDQEAFELLVERYHRQFFRMASVSLVVPEHAADVTQEVFIRAYRGLPRFRFQAEPYTWLYRTMKNVCREFNRKERYVAREMEDVESTNSLEKQTADRQQLKKVRQVLEELPERQREVVLLRIFEERSVAETARAMKCRPGTVKALLHQALQKLRQSEFKLEH